jgi:hypothetical protein
MGCLVTNRSTMTLKLHSLTKALVASSAIFLSSCYSEDPGPIQDYEKQYSMVDFDRIEMGDAFKITVIQSNLFEVTASGDRRNIEDLIVEKEGSTLIVRFDENRSRRHNTEIEIKMPALIAATLSGASDSRIFGFDDSASLDIRLSGASICQFDGSALQIDAVVSGASYLYMYGDGEKLTADVSGASVLKAFHYPVKEAHVHASGASDGHITVQDNLNAIASGASVITYRGNPVVTAEILDSSTIRQD